MYAETLFITKLFIKIKFHFKKKKKNKYIYIYEHETIKYIKIYGDVAGDTKNIDFKQYKFSDPKIIGIENDADTTIKDSIIIFPANGNGFVGINKMDPTTNLDVSGSLTVSGAVSAASYNATSDYRIKTSVTSLNENYTIDELEPKYYYNRMNGKYEVGFIAHEIETKYPFLVNGKKDDECYQSINYNGIIGLLTNEIKMLKKEMRILKEEMRTMKGFK